MKTSRDLHTDLRATRLDLRFTRTDLTLAADGEAQTDLLFLVASLGMLAVAVVASMMVLA